MNWSDSDPRLEKLLNKERQVQNPFSVRTKSLIRCAVQICGTDHHFICILNHVSELINLELLSTPTLSGDQSDFQLTVTKGFKKKKKSRDSA